MKKTNLIKTMFFGAAFFGMLTVSSCKQEPKPEDTKEVAEDQNDAKFEETNDAKEDDSAYLVAAAETDMEEIEVGKLAIAKGTDPGVKKFGQMLIDDHTKAAATTKALAQTKNISLPAAITDKGKEAVEDLNKEKTGKDFDMKFADMMVDGHEKAISKMTDASEKATDPEIKSWAGNMVPTLKGHLEHAKMLKETIKNKK